MRRPARLTPFLPFQGGVLSSVNRARVGARGTTPRVMMRPIDRRRGGSRPGSRLQLARAAAAAGRGAGREHVPSKCSQRARVRKGAAATDAVDLCLTPTSPNRSGGLPDLIRGRGVNLGGFLLAFWGASVGPPRRGGFDHARAFVRGGPIGRDPRLQIMRTLRHLDSPAPPTTHQQDCPLTLTATVEPRGAAWVDVSSSRTPAEEE